MPRVWINGINLYYETHGNPDSLPLLLICGLSGYTRSWDRFLPALSQDFFVILFDNRGVGKSDKPPAPYTMDELAADAEGILDHLDIESANVFGTSMGGMIAQHLALKSPDRVLHLALGCTSCDGAVVSHSARVANMLKPLPEQPQEREKVVRRQMRLLLSPTFLRGHPKEVDRLIIEALSNNQPIHAFLGQLAAARRHNTCARLTEIHLPTLVMHGTDDIVVPPENGLLLAQRIPGAQFISFEKAGHLFYIEQINKVNDALIPFYQWK